MAMETYRYLALYKPYGVLSSFTDPENRPTLKDYVNVAGVYTAGRLDYDSEGLLLLTDDGSLIHQMTDPRFHLPKTYWVEVEGLITVEAASTLEKGVILQGERTRRCQVLPIPEPALPPRTKPVTPHAPVSWLRIVLREGKKRQIRHMTAAVGFPTLRIVRVAIGPINLEGLQPGQWRLLSDNEIRQLRKVR
ncbi:MAG TPA: pseudouridine synthase [Anaerolineaceae bacterium]|nr:pseudouridine synthase [Anaerolineaceae bacterium]